MQAEKPDGISRETYVESLTKFDVALCEAIAVSQTTAGRYSEPNVGYASFVFTQMCGAGVSLVRAAPLNRWVRSDSDDWRFGAVAGHARSLVDGYLLFCYLAEPPRSEEELRTRINVMHLNDCTRRIELFTNLGFLDSIEGFEKQRAELRERLSNSDYFRTLPAPVQKNCMNGRYLTIDTRDQLLERVGFEKGQFDGIYDLWSQHVHILPMSFYRMEPNGRGTGVENATDRTYATQALDTCSAALVESTNKMVAEFPDAADVRKGLKSTFSPGPAANRPRKANPVAGSPKPSLLSMAIKKSLRS